MLINYIYSFIKDLYKKTLENFINYITLDNSSFDKQNVTNWFNHYTGFKVIPLRNSFESLGNELEYEFIKSISFYEDFDNLFVYDSNYSDYLSIMMVY